MNVTIAASRNRRLIITTRGASAVFTRKSLRVVVGNTGMQGPPGSGGGGAVDPITITRVADMNLSGHRAVKPVAGARCGYASAASAGDALNFLGITTGAVLAEGNVDVVTEGRMVEPSWSWTPGARIYLGVDGVLTETPDSGWAFIQIVAVAIAATEIFVNPQPAIVT